MEQRSLGATGLLVTPIGLGGYPFGGVNRAAGWDPLTPVDGRDFFVRREPSHNAVDPAAEKRTSSCSQRSRT